MVDPSAKGTDVDIAVLTGCVLVGPDGHVVWRCVTGGPDGPQQLSDAVDRALGSVPSANP
jgi:hypothetical protein